VNLLVVEGVCGSEAHKSVILIRSQLGLLVPHVSILAELLNLGEVKLLVLVSCEVVHSASVLGSNVVDLSQEFFLDDRVVDVAHHLGCVRVEVCSCTIIHDTCVELADLVVLADLALVVVMALAGNDIVRNLVGRLSHVRTELV